MGFALILFMFLWFPVDGKGGAFLVPQVKGFPFW